MQNGAFLEREAEICPRRSVHDLDELQLNPNVEILIEKGTRQSLRLALRRERTSESQYLLLVVEGRIFLHRHLFLLVKLDFAQHDIGYVLSILLLLFW